MTFYFRPYGGEGITLCEHIKLPDARIMKDDDGGEYLITLKIKCCACKKVFTQELIVN